MRAAAPDQAEMEDFAEAVLDGVIVCREFRSLGICWGGRGKGFGRGDSQLCRGAAELWHQTRHAKTQFCFSQGELCGLTPLLFNRNEPSRPLLHCPCCSVVTCYQSQAGSRTKGGQHVYLDAVGVAAFFATMTRP